MGDEERLEPDPLLDAWNKAYEGIPVNTDYTIEYYISGSAYRLTSPGGRIKIEQVPKTEVLPKRDPSWVRVTIADDHTLFVLDEKEEDEAFMDKLNAQWKISVIGNQDQLNRFRKQTESHQQRIKSHIENERAKLIATGVLQEDEQEAEQLRQALAMDAEKAKRPVPDSAIVKSPAPPQKPMKDKSVFDQADRHLDKVQKWLLFSAVSAMSGNMGQGNYTAGNAYLDVITWQTRQLAANSMNTTLMWGAVANIGMRWKAFATQDFLAGTTNLFSIEDACKILYLTGVKETPVEWLGAALFDVGAGQSQGGGYIDGGEDFIQPNHRIASALGWTDKELRGLSKQGPWVSPLRETNGLLEPLEISGMSLQDEPEEQALEPLEVGARVELVGWKNRTEMNGLRGTLCRQMRSGKWRVSVDGLGEKFLEPKHLHVLPDSTKEHSATSTTITVQQEQALEDQAVTSLPLGVDQFTVGDHVRLTCPNLPADMKGQLGTLLMKTRKGKWWLKLKINSEDKLVDPSQLEIISPSSNVQAAEEASYNRSANIDVLNVELSTFLRSACPDWSTTCLAAVQEKLAKVQINNLPELLIHFSTAGGKVLNEKLKAAGEKCFTLETLRVLCSAAESAGNPGTLGLLEVLRVSCPQWSERQVLATQEKLLKIQIKTKEDLKQSLELKVPHSLNDKLRLAGEKTFSSDTLQALREQLK